MIKLTSKPANIALQTFVVLYALLMIIALIAYAVWLSKEVDNETMYLIFVVLVGLTFAISLILLEFGNYQIISFIAFILLIVFTIEIHAFSAMRIKRFDLIKTEEEGEFEGELEGESEIMVAVEKVENARFNMSGAAAITANYAAIITGLIAYIIFYYSAKEIETETSDVTVE